MSRQLKPKGMSAAIFIFMGVCMQNHKGFNYGNSKMAWLIDEYVHSERDRQILRRRFLDGITQDAVANEQNMSKRQIQYIERWFIQVIVSLHQDKLI